MSATRTRRDFQTTLTAPHASHPTLDADLRIYDIRTGPKRTAHFNRWDSECETHLFVPPIESWTLETVRMTLWELAAFLPGASDVPDGEGAFPRWVAENDVKAMVTRGRSTFRLTVELPKVGVTTSFQCHKMTPPMRAALESLPTAPFPLAGIGAPASQADGEREDSLKDVQSLQRISETLKELTHIQPEAVQMVGRLMERLRKEYGLDDDEKD